MTLHGRIANLVTFRWKKFNGVKQKSDGRQQRADYPQRPGEDNPIHATRESAGPDNDGS
jgi:hypothetical protein